MKLITRQSLVVIGIALTAILLALGISAQAEQPKKISRIGYLESLPRRNPLGLKLFAKGFASWVIRKAKTL